MKEDLPTGVDHLPSGAYRFRLQHGTELLSGTASTPELAAQMRQELKRQIVDGELAPTKGKSAKELGPRFLGSRIENRSAEDDSSRWNRHCATALWSRKAVGAVVRADGTAWLKALKKRKTEPEPHSDPKKRGGRRAEYLGWQTRKHCMNLARAFFAWAVDEELIASNPFEGLMVERDDNDEDSGYQDTWYLDGEEQARFLACWDTFEDTRRRERLIVEIAMGTGLRMNEQWCLHLADIHVDGDNPHIFVRYGSWSASKRKFLPPKGRKGTKRVREVQLFGMALVAAKAWLAQLSEYAPKNPMGLVFPTERGCRRTKPPRSWDAAVTQFGDVPRIGRRPWWHLMRHTCGSSMVSGWWGMRWELLDISKVLGHKDTKTTQMYAHLAPKVVAETANRAHAAYLGSCHGAVTAQRPAARKPRNDWHARCDSNTRHSASKAARNATIGGEITRHDRDVTAFRHVLELVARGEVPASPEVVRWLGEGLDWALEAYATAAIVEERRA